MTDRSARDAIPQGRHNVGKQVVAHESHDEIHVVAPSWWPLVLAVAITMALAGTVLSPLMSIIGLVLMIVAIVNWLSELRRDFRPTHSDPNEPRDEPFQA